MAAGKLGRQGPRTKGGRGKDLSSAITEVAAEAGGKSSRSGSMPRVSTGMMKSVINRKGAAGGKG